MQPGVRNPHWTIKQISEALGIGTTTVSLIVGRWKKRGHKPDLDRRKGNGMPQKLSEEQQSLMKDRDLLQAQSHMSLRERSKDLEKLGISISHDGLRKYYRRWDIRFKTVDLHSVNKINRAEQLKTQQLQFLTDLLLLSASKTAYFMDETTVHRWIVKRRTW